MQVISIFNNYNLLLLPTYEFCRHLTFELLIIHLHQSLLISIHIFFLNNILVKTQGSMKV